MPGLTATAGLAGAALGVAGLLAGRRLLVLVTVEGGSMHPVLRHGDRVLAVRTPPARVRRGRLVVGRPPDDRPDRPAWLRAGEGGPVVPLPPERPRWFVKRVTGLPGERVRPRHPAVDRSGTPLAPEVVVPVGAYYVEGEASVSVDSGVWGSVARDRLLGVVVCPVRRPAGRG